MSIWGTDVGKEYEEVLARELRRRAFVLRRRALRGAQSGGGNIPKAYSQHIVKKMAGHDEPR